MYGYIDARSNPIKIRKPKGYYMIRIIVGIVSIIGLGAVFERIAFKSAQQRLRKRKGLS